MSQVRSLFHEMGHALHNVLSVTRCARFHGTRVERDFVEVPSVMFEYFFWTARHIKEVSCHYAYQSPQYMEAWIASRTDIGEQRTLPTRQLPDKLVEDLLELRYSSKPLDLLRDLHYATYDMIMHTPQSHEELNDMNLCEVFNKTRNEIMCLEGGEALGEGWEWAHFESIFRHVNGGDYDVGYYAYLM
jgi:metallopeptidase MepB